MIKNVLIGLSLLWFVGCAAQSEFDYVCDELEVIYDISCDNLSAPILVYSELVEYNGWYGVYFRGEHYIFINPNYPNMFLEIERHETVHYVLDHLGIYELITKCEGERIARLISFGEWSARHKRQYNCSN